QLQDVKIVVVEQHGERAVVRRGAALQPGHVVEHVYRNDVVVDAIGLPVPVVQNVKTLLPGSMIVGGEKCVEGVGAEPFAQTAKRPPERSRGRQISDQMPAGGSGEC